MKRFALPAFLAAVIAVHAIVGWWQPLQTDDWEQLLWDVRHDGGWLATHFAFSDVVSYAIVHARWLHAALCGVAYAAVVLGAFVLAHRRLPRFDAWHDALDAIAISALIWITQPRTGFVVFDRPNVAIHLCGCAVALWLIAPFRCAWRVGRAGAVALAIAGYAVGTSSRQIAAATLVGVILAVRRTPAAERARWMWIAVGALVVGATAGFIDAPRVEALRVFRRGFEPTLIVLNLPIRECGQLIALILLLALARLTLDALRPQPAAPGATALPTPAQTRTWLWTWLAIVVACLFGPRYGEPTLLPASLVLVVAALPYLRWLAAVRPLRWAITAMVIGTHAIAWATALPLFARLDDEFQDRMARLSRAPAGSIGVIAPYSVPMPTAWFFGEDWGPASRQVIGIDLFGLRDIAFEPRFGRLEDNPRLTVELDAAGLSDAQRALVPTYWATEVAGAREQFERFVERAAALGGDQFTAQLTVAAIEFAERRGRPLVIAHYDHGAKTAPRVLRGNPDPNDRQQITLAPAIVAAYPEAYALEAGVVAPTRHDGAYRVQPMVGGLTAVIACNAQRCLLVDAFLPRF